jgi:hypothetical protein
MVHLKFVLVAALCQSLELAAANPACATTNSESTTTTTVPTTIENHLRLASAIQTNGTIGVMPHKCAPDQEMIGNMCFSKSECPAGYTLDGAVCYQNCPNGFREKGFYSCQMDLVSYGRGAGYP